MWASHLIANVKRQAIVNGKRYNPRRNSYNMAESVISFNWAVNYSWHPLDGGQLGPVNFGFEINNGPLLAVKMVFIILFWKFPT